MNTFTDYMDSLDDNPETKFQDLERRILNSQTLRSHALFQSISRGMRTLIDHSRDIFDDPEKPEEAPNFIRTMNQILDDNDRRMATELSTALDLLLNSKLNIDDVYATERTRGSDVLVATRNQVGGLMVA